MGRQLVAMVAAERGAAVADGEASPEAEALLSWPADFDAPSVVDDEQPAAARPSDSAAATAAVRRVVLRAPSR